MGTTGSLSLSSGSSWTTTDDVNIGAGVPSTGLVSIDSGAQLDVGGILTIGDNSSDALVEVDGGGTLSAHRIEIASEPNSEATLISSGGNIVVNSSSFFFEVGRRGEAEVRLSGTANVDVAGSLVLGSALTGNGTFDANDNVVVDVAGSTFIGGMPSFILNSGTGKLDLGGEVDFSTANLSLGVLPNSQGTFSQDGVGAGSNVTVIGDVRTGEGTASQCEFNINGNSLLTIFEDLLIGVSVEFAVSDFNMGTEQVGQDGPIIDVLGDVSFNLNGGADSFVGVEIDNGTLNTMNLSFGNSNSALFASTNFVDIRGGEINADDVQFNGNVKIRESSIQNRVNSLGTSFCFDRIAKSGGRTQLGAH